VEPVRKRTGNRRHFSDFGFSATVPPPSGCTAAVFWVGQLTVCGGEATVKGMAANAGHFKRRVPDHVRAEVARLRALGHTRRQIADATGLSRSTVGYLAKQPDVREQIRWERRAASSAVGAGRFAIEDCVTHGVGHIAPSADLSRRGHRRSTNGRRANIMRRSLRSTSFYALDRVGRSQ
jgi:Homeodomain-like domain-containing protein